MDVNLATLATMIAILHKQYIGVREANLEDEILKGLKLARILSYKGEISREAEGYLSFATGQKNVTAAGTPVQLPDLPVKSGTKLTMIAKPGNTGIIYFASSEEVCGASAQRFDGLDAGLAHSFVVNNANKIWIDASVSGEGVSYYVEK